MAQEPSLIDWDLAIQRANHDRNLANDLLALFVTNLPAELLALKIAASEQNYSELQRLAHKMHGGLRYCGLPRLQNLVASLETELKNHIIDSLPTLLNQLDTEATLLIELISRQPQDSSA